MWPILLCSIVAMAIITERFWTLQRRKIVPDNLVLNVWQWINSGQLDDQRIKRLQSSSPLGRILAAGLVNRHRSREIMKESIEDVGRHVVHELERYLDSLGTIASVAPLLGLLGTVVGLIQVFMVVTTHGLGDPTLLANGIAQALITTAAGLIVAIPTLMFYRFFRSRVNELVVTMEQEAMKMMEALQPKRRVAKKRIEARASH
jgi:biopolymer transport protein ExbB